MNCRHCNGTGKAPDRIKLECVSCQSGVTITYGSSSELMEKLNDGKILCADCTPTHQQETTNGR